MVNENERIQKKMKKKNKQKNKRSDFKKVKNMAAINTTISIIT